ncbi:hypothetical protein BWQ96_05117 [Gracilariopsis chorda]|uniref:Putative restriction endonuclease domain-containing protein n=1 Tax=Gracilariopsis chorda TaxID=448386 RepID=A0A2V3ISP6_9FLOR|nr:hypothetical protein BWQ96_05117 [Gracilariopsis chorda]|eukprot:PXF45143.1 hypothetical protein BWQ96_05117 [Gracilariopsis chorda]
MIRSALLTGAPCCFRFKSSSTSYTSGLRPGPNNGQAAIAILRNVLREEQSSVNHEGMEKTPSPVASSCAQGRVLPKGRSPVMITLKDFHLEPVKYAGLTVDAYHELIETGFLDHARGELIDGFFIPMRPQSPRHSKVVKNLIRLLASNFLDVAEIGPATPISLSDGKSEPEPDITLSKQGVYDHPGPRDIFVVVEVSNSSLDFDSTTKLTKYATSGIPEYWRIDVNKRTVRILRNPQGNRFMYDEVFFEGRITLAAFPKKEIEFGDIFLGLPAS